MTLVKSNTIKLQVKPIFIGFYHDYVYEGPCRFGSGDDLTKEADQKANKVAYAQFLDDLDTYLSIKEVKLLKPVYVDRNEEFQVTEKMLDAMAKDSGEVDLYLFGEKGRGYDVIVEFAQRCKKPVMFAENSLYTAITAPALLARGLETYPTMTWEDTVEQLKVLRVRKVLRDTRILLAPRGNSNITFSSTDSFVSLEEVTNILGVRFRYIDAHELLDQTHCIEPDSNYTLPGRKGLNPTKEDMKEIEKITDELINGAEECDMKREDVFNSVKAYYTVKKALEHHECNAFSMPCPDMCATRRLNQEKITFCLTHSLLNEEGIPSACEYDIPALISMIILMNFADSAPYMGNTFPTLLRDGKRVNLWPRFFQAEASQTVDIPELEDMENVMITFHSVPNRRLRGFGHENAPYSLRPFARDGNWGATIRYNFKEDKGQILTMCRIDPTCKKLFLARGKVVGGIGYTDKNCSQGVFFTVDNDRDFFMKQVAFGNHVPLVYGDYFNEIKELGKVLGLEVVTA